MTTLTTYPGIGLLTAVIARSPIVVAGVCKTEPAARLARLPDGFDDVDLAVLDWIAAEARRIGKCARI